MYQGYIKLWRKLQDNNLWTHEKFTRGQAWVDLILLANHKPKKVMIRGIEIFVDRGQLAQSELTLSKRWKWSRNKTRKFLKYLSQKTIHQIKQETNNITSIITILNYEAYQGDSHQTGHQKEHQKDTKRNTNNNDKNDKNIIYVHFDLFWSCYPKKKSKGQAEKTWAKLYNKNGFPGIDTLLAAIERQKKSVEWQKDKGQFIPHASTWLNAKGWLDEFECKPKTKILTGKEALYYEGS